MDKLKSSISFETAFGVYVVDEVLGEGGAGRVYGGEDPDGAPIALKVLAEERASRDKRSRFKNEIAFLARNKHRNIITVIDHGVARGSSINGPFYVMRRYPANMRELIRKRIPADDVLPLFSEVLDGVEAAHLQGVVHRDLKPENILYDPSGKQVVIADFGIARFTEDILATLVQTSPTQRLANFQYAAPEQRAPGQAVGATADIFALGLILNEMVTGVVPQGTKYQLISGVSNELAFLDGIVAKMLRQVPADRPPTIADLKALIQHYQAETVSLQRLSQYDGAVIHEQEIDEPLAFEPPRLVSFDWNGRQLTLSLDREVSPAWVGALQRMDHHAAVFGKGPETFRFEGKRALVDADEHEVQPVIDRFKSWLPAATAKLKHLLEQNSQRQKAQRLDQLRREREAEEKRLRVLRNTKI